MQLIEILCGQMCEQQVVLADNLLDVMPGKLDSLLERLYTTARVNT